MASRSRQVRPPPAFGLVSRLGQQAGLPDSGLACEQHSFASTAQRGIDRARQYRELCAARNQRKFGAHILHYSTSNEPPCLQSAISVFTPDTQRLRFLQS